jgi:hypothetical protein
MNRILFTLGLCITLLTATMLLFASDVMAKSSTPNARKLFRQTARQMGVVQKSLSALNSSVRVLGFSLQRDSQGIMNSLLAAREELQQCVETAWQSCHDPESVYRARKWILQMQENKMRNVSLLIEKAQNRLALLEERLAGAAAALTTLNQYGAATDDDTAFLQSNVRACEQSLTSMRLGLPRILPLLEDGDLGESTDASAADDVNDYLNLALHGLRFSASVGVIDEALAHAQALVAAAVEIRVALSDDLEQCQGHLNRILAVLRELRLRCQLHCPKKSAESGLPQGVDAFHANLVGSVHAAIYTLGGRLVSEISTVTHALTITSGLPNGVYLILLRESSPSGPVTRLSKIIVTR